jgi:hypothetical protein
MQQAMRVLEHAARISIRVASTSSSSTTGRLAAELADYVKRLKREQELGRTEEFYRLLHNAQMKLVKLLCDVLR